MKGVLSSAFLLAAVALAGCTVHQTEAPGLSGPSGLSLTIRVSALPDSISQDGGSQSSIQVTAIGPDGKPKSGQPVRLDMFVNGVGMDYGTLSARTAVTNSSGVATAVYTAPPSPVGGLFGTCQGLPGNCVQIVATASGTGFEGASPEIVTIRLVPPGVILPPASTPTAQFAFAPAAPAANDPVAFDASASCAGQAGATGGCLSSNNVLTDFSWNFGDGKTGSGKTVTHNFSSAGTYNVTLTVTNDRGLTASTTKQVGVGAGAKPTAAFVFSPTPVLTGVDTFFDASASAAAPGHRIATYAWNFGDGDPIKTNTTPTTQHDFGNVGTFIVLLTVTDESGQSATATQSVAVTAPAGGSAGAPTANFTSSPTTPVVSELVVFDSSSSTVATGRTITDYAWNFGDDTPIIHGDNRIISHTYARPGTFVVNLVITDNTGATGQKSAPVLVSSGDPSPVITASPSTAQVNTQVGFSSAGSKTFGGATIVSYSWDFGNPGSVGNTSVLANPTHTFNAVGTFTVRLTITDSQGRIGTATATVTITP